MRRGLGERPEHSVAGPGSRARLEYNFGYTAATLKLLMGNHLADPNISNKTHPLDVSLLNGLVHGWPLSKRMLKGSGVNTFAGLNRATNENP